LSTVPSLRTLVTGRGCVRTADEDPVLFRALAQQAVNTSLIATYHMAAFLPAGVSATAKNTVLHQTTQEALSDLEDRLRDADKTAQHFIWIHLWDAHWPYRRDWLLNDHGYDHPRLTSYEGTLRRVDAAIETVVSAVKASAFTRKAVVITADHGEQFGEHGGYLHRGRIVTTEVSSIPMALWSPGLEPRRVQRPVTLLDVGSTILEFFRIDPATYVEGYSLMKPDAIPEDRVVMIGPVGPYRSSALVQGEWRLDYVGENESFQLFETEVDKGNHHDVYAQHPDVARHMERLLLSELASGQQYCSE